jgi:protein-S-isoprenylcysteine O-methyltransferase Ste14
MTSEAVFRALLLALLLAFVIHRGYYTRRYGRPAADTLRARERSLAQTVSAGLSLVALLSSAVYIVRPAWVAWASLPLPVALRWLGVGVAVAGFALLQWAHSALSRNWSDAPRLMTGQTLTTNGPYRWMRHPMYTAFLLILSAPLLISANWLVGLSWLAATALDIAGRIRFEEALLAETFGDQYAEYASHSGRLLPRL